MKKGKNFLGTLSFVNDGLVKVLRKYRGKRGGVFLVPCQGYYFCGDKYVVFLESDVEVDRPIVYEWSGPDKPDVDMIYDSVYLWKSMIRIAKCDPFAKKELLRPDVKLCVDDLEELFQACVELVKGGRMLISGPWIVLMNDENGNWALLVRSAGRV